MSQSKQMFMLIRQQQLELEDDQRNVLPVELQIQGLVDYVPNRLDGEVHQTKPCSTDGRKPNYASRECV